MVGRCGLREPPEQHFVEIDRRKIVAVAVVVVVVVMKGMGSE